MEETFIVNRNKFISSSLGEEIMLLNLETGDYIGLNEVSADIYRQAENKTTASDIIEYLLKKYNVDENVCKAQVLRIINEMTQKELLVKI